MNVTNALFTSTLSIDKILNVITGSFTAVQNTGSVSTGASAATGINDLVYFDGVYTIDGGAPQDFGTLASTSGGSQSFQAWLRCTSNNVDVRYTSQDVASHTIAYKIFVISKPSNTLYTVIPSPVSKAYLSSQFNYQKIALENTQAFTVNTGTIATPVDTTVTIAHNLGYRPAVRAFIDNGTALVSTMDNTSYGDVIPANATAIPLVTEDNSNVYFTYTNNGSSFSLNLSYRIYYEPN